MSRGDLGLAGRVVQHRETGMTVRGERTQAAFLREPERVAVVPPREIDVGRRRAGGHGAEHAKRMRLEPALAALHGERVGALRALPRALDIAGDEHTHYDVRPESHVNIVCTSCGRIVDVDTDTLEALLGLVAARSGYRLNPRDGVIVYGQCPSCAAAST